MSSDFEKKQFSRERVTRREFSSLDIVCNTGYGTYRILSADASSHGARIAFGNGSQVTLQNSYDEVLQTELQQETAPSDSSPPLFFPIT
jgi:hypothetical protein